MAHSTMDSSTTSTMHTTRCPFYELPTEIFHKIFATVDQQDLINCARSTKSLYKLTEPYLWRRVRVETVVQKECFQTTAAQQALVRNANHVRDVYLDRELFSFFLPQTSTSSTRSTTQAFTCSSSSSSSSLVPFLPSEPRLDGFLPAICTGLQRLHLHATGLTEDTIERMEDAIASLLRQNASLTNVTLGAFNMSAMASMRLTSTMSPWMAKLLLEGLPESIRKVVMDVEVNNNEPNETVLPTAHDLVLRNHDLLENLTIHWKWNYEIYEADTIFAVAEETVLIPFLYSCTNLKDFGEYTTEMFGNHKIRTALDQLGIQCTCLNFGALPGVSTDQEMAHTIQLCQWQEISFSSFRIAGPQTLAAVLELAEHLRVLDVTCYRHFSSQYMCALLGKCSALVKLIAIDGSMPIAVYSTDQEFILSPVISGADFIQLDWPFAPSLKSWICMITVPRPDIDGDEHDPTDNVVEARRIQQQVYQTLAQLTGLRELCLGLLDVGTEDVNERPTSCVEE